MKCRDCPYGKEDFKRRMYWYNKIIRERGIPNDIYHHLQPEDAANEFEQFLWCDKVGGKVYCFGHCTDFYEDTDVINCIESSKQKRKNKRERDLKHKNRMKFLAENISSCLSPVVYMDEIYVNGIGWVKNSKPYYKKIFYGTNCKRYYKRRSNKCVRRYKKELHNGCYYKKIFDYRHIVIKR